MLKQLVKDSEEMSGLNVNLKKEMMAVVLIFLQDSGFDRSYNAVLDEIREKMPQLEPSTDLLQQRHASPFEKIHFILQIVRSGKIMTGNSSWDENRSDHMACDGYGYLTGTVDNFFVETENVNRR